jgi:hypothetical protein
MREDESNFAEPLPVRVRGRLSNAVRDDLALVALDAEYPPEFGPLGGARELILMSAWRGDTIFDEWKEPLKVYIGGVHRTRDGRIDADATQIEDWGFLFRSRVEAARLASPRQRR